MTHSVCSKSGYELTGSGLSLSGYSSSVLSEPVSDEPRSVQKANSYQLYACVQMAEGLFSSPKIIGDRVGLHPLTVIVAVLVGTSLLGGIIGGVLAIPLTAALRTLMFRYIWKKPGLIDAPNAVPAIC